MSTRGARLVVGAAVAACLAAAPVPAAAAVPASTQADPTVPAPTQADRRIAEKLPARLATAGLDGDTVVLVRDVATGRTVWSRRSSAALMPASNAKLPTAVAALATFSADHRFATRVRAGASAREVVLVGGGDPSLRTRGLGRLAKRTAARLEQAKVTRARVWVDDSLFPAPTPAPGWHSSYHPHEVAPVRALIVDQREVMDTGLDAGRRFAAQLAKQGVKASLAGRKRATRDAALLAELEGQPMSGIVRDMLLRSDNDIAEYLFRHVALRTGHRPDWAGAARAERQVLARLGVPLAGVRLHDGSGLSRRDRLTPAALVHLLTLAAAPDHPELRTLQASLPVAGRTGTLGAAYGRFTTSPSRCAVGRVSAKTGTLRDVVALSGLARSGDGRLKAFAILVNGPASTLATKRKVDGLAATITGCW